MEMERAESGLCVTCFGEHRRRETYYRTHGIETCGRECEGRHARVGGNGRTCCWRWWWPRNGRRKLSRRDADCGRANNHRRGPWRESFEVGKGRRQVHREGTVEQSRQVRSVQHTRAQRGK